MADDKKADPKKPERVPAQIPPNNILGGEFTRNVWTVSAPGGVLPEDLEKSRIYEQIVGRVRVGDHLEVTAEDGSWFALVLVRNKEASTIRPGVLLVKTFEDAAIPGQAFGELDIRWRGPIVKWGVVRKSDNAVLQENLASKNDAVAWAAEHMRSFPN